MNGFDIFNADAFTATSLTKAMEHMGFVPQFLSTIPGLFEPVPIRTKSVWIERRGYSAKVLQTSPRGTAPTQVGGDKRDARAFNTVRIIEASRIYADELLSIRRFGAEIDLKDLIMEVARRQFKINADHDLTEEYHRLNVVTQAKTLDADGTVIYDWNNEFSAAPSGSRALSAISPVTFSLAANTAGTVRTNCNSIVRSIRRNLNEGKANNANVKIVGLCGDAFYDALVTHTDVIRTFLNWQSAKDLRGPAGAVFQPMEFADIEFINYRGTDDNSTVAVPTNSCRFFPRNSGIFQVARSPGEKFEDVGDLGKDRYSWMVMDIQRNMWADVEVATYPLHVCALPQALALGNI